MVCYIDGINKLTKKHLFKVFKKQINYLLCFKVDILVNKLFNNFLNIGFIPLY